MPLVRSFLKLTLSLTLLLGGLGVVLGFAYLLGQTGRAQAGSFNDKANGSVAGTFMPDFVGNTVPVTIVEEDARHVFYTSAGNVAAALQDAGIALGPEDRVEPAPTTTLVADMQIVIYRPVPVTIHADGRVVHRRIGQGNVGEALAAAGIVVQPPDYTRPGLEAPVQPDMVIDVVRITESFVDEDEPIPYDTVWEPTDTLELDTEGLLVPGEEGILRRRWQVTYENGVEVDRALAEEWEVQEPVPEVMGYGTNVVIRVLNTAEGPLPYWRKVKMRVTSYTASSAGRPPDHPLYGVTASGYMAQTGIVAVDTRVIPFRSWVYVPGYGLGYAGDTGGGVLGRWIDLGFYEEEFVPWSGYVEVYYLTPIPDPERINYRLPAELP